MYNYIVNFINKHNILYNYKFGFRQQYSTSHAIILLVEKINEALYKANIMIGVYTDLKKAFDTVDHNILRKKCLLMESEETYLNGLYVIWVTGNSMLS